MGESWYFTAFAREMLQSSRSLGCPPPGQPGRRRLWSSRASHCGWCPSWFSASA